MKKRSLKVICELENDLGNEVFKQLFCFCGGLMLTLAGHQSPAKQARHILEKEDQL